MLARYELCEDMACMLTEHAQKLAFDEEVEQKEWAPLIIEDD